MSALVDNAMLDRPAARLLRALVESLRQFPRPWPSIPEAEQQQHIDRLGAEVRTALATSVTEIAGDGYTKFGCDVESLIVKGEVAKISLKLPTLTEHIDALLTRVGSKAVLVLVPDPTDYLDGIEAVRADKDQPELPMAEGASEEITLESDEEEEEDAEAGEDL